MVVAFVCIPVIVWRVGTERFGMLNLAWMVIGYFTLFDFGLGRALTKLVAEKLGQERHDDLPALIWTASTMMLGMGVAGGIVLALLSPFLVTHTFKVIPGMQQEMLGTLYLLAAAIPLVISTTGLRGILEAHQRFDLSNRLCFHGSRYFPRANGGPTLHEQSILDHHCACSGTSCRVVWTFVLLSPDHAGT
jgi:O-antigen/teichoic acid export membrane protein